MSAPSITLAIGSKFIPLAKVKKPPGSRESSHQKVADVVLISSFILLLLCGRKFLDGERARKFPDQSGDCEEILGVLRRGFFNRLLYSVLHRGFSDCRRCWLLRPEIFGLLIGSVSSYVQHLYYRFLLRFARLIWWIVDFVLGFCGLGLKLFSRSGAILHQSLSVFVSFSTLQIWNQVGYLNAELQQNFCLHILEQFNAGLFDCLIATDDSQLKEMSPKSLFQNMAGGRNSLRVVRRLVEAQSCLRKSERKLKRQRSRVRARKLYQKVAKEQYTSACRDVFKSRNRLNQIDAVKRLKAIDQLNARKCIQKLAVDHFASASSDLKISRNRLSKITYQRKN